MNQYQSVGEDGLTSGLNSIISRAVKGQGLFLLSRRQTPGDKKMGHTGDTASSELIAELEVVIQNSQGLHARPAAQFVRVASKYPSVELTVVKEGMSVNGKSIIGIMMLAAGPGSTLQLRAQGDGANQLLTDLQDLVNGHFGE